MDDHRDAAEPLVARDECPKAELLALYLDGRCSPAQVNDIEKHVAGCEECYAVVVASVRMDQAERADPKTQASTGPRWTGRWFAIALATAALVLLMVELGRREDRSSRDLQVALLDLDHASRPYRVFESRASLMPTHRPVQPLVRSGSSAPPISPDLQAVIDRVRTAATRPDVTTQRALGTMYLALGDAGRAATAMDPLASSSDPGVMNDVAAAWLARAAEGDESRAFALLQRAVAIERGRPEIWFNLALAANATGDRGLARSALAQVISLEPDSAWAGEAQRRLESIRN